MAKRGTYRDEIWEQLIQPRIAKERSKHDDKIKDKEYIRGCEPEDFDKTKLLTKIYFYQDSTAENCFNTAGRFIDWCKREEVSEKRLPIQEYGQFIEGYINYRIEQGAISPRSIAKERAELSKVWQINTDYIKIPAMKTESDKGRTADPHYNMNSEQHRLATEFYTMIGARKAEYHMMKDSEFLHYREQVKELYGIEIRQNKWGQTPNIYPLRNPETKLIDRVIVCHAKHGKSNMSEILPEHQRRITDIFEQREYLNYMNPADHCNIHACRRAYAQALYFHYARPLDTLTREEKFICRDGSGRQFDREAVAKVSESLGHKADDLFDTIHNYLR